MLYNSTCKKRDAAVQPQSQETLDLQLVFHLSEIMRPSHPLSLSYPSPLLLSYMQSNILTLPSGFCLDFYIWAARGQRGGGANVVEKKDEDDAMIPNLNLSFKLGLSGWAANAFVRSFIRFSAHSFFLAAATAEYVRIYVCMYEIIYSNGFFFNLSRPLCNPHT